MGSTPTETTLRASNSIGRVSVFQTGCCRFDPCLAYFRTVNSMVRVSALHAGCWGFDSLTVYFWDVVQWLERAVDNRQTKVQFFPSQPFSGGFFQWQETRFASEQWGFDSPRLHHFTKDSSMVEQPAEDGRIVVQFHFLRPYCRILFWLNRTVS